jgi:hypothetical protein
MTALEYLKRLRHQPFFPCSVEGRKTGLPSNSEIKRWLQKGSVLINGIYPKPDEPIDFPIRQLIFRAKSPNRITIWDEIY